MVLAKGFAPGLVRKPHIDGIMNSAYIILHQELERLLAKSQREGLTATEAQTLERYISSLKKLASEEREQRTADRLEDMSDEELQKAVASLKLKDSNAV